MRAVVFVGTFLAGAIWLLSPGMAHAGEQPSDCMACHKSNELPVDPARYEMSVHHALACTDCHIQGYGKIPHASGRAKAPTCIDCHSGDFDAIVREVKESVHVQMVDSDFRCTNCHSLHYYNPASRRKDLPEVLSAFKQSCLGCHAEGNTSADKQAALERLVEKHRLLTHEKIHIERIACVACHTPIGEKTVHRILPKPKALRDCGACHSQNSQLVAKLYTYSSPKEREERGWLNAALYKYAYVTGATRNRWLDWGTVMLAVLVLLFVGFHGAGRWLCGRRRRNKS